MRTGIASLNAFDFFRQVSQVVSEVPPSRARPGRDANAADFTSRRRSLARPLSQCVPASGLVGARGHGPPPMIDPPVRQETSQESHNRQSAPPVTSQLQRLKLGALPILAQEYAPAARPAGVPHTRTVTAARGLWSSSVPRRVLPTGNG